jgi:hypothetical protein
MDAHGTSPWAEGPRIKSGHDDQWSYYFVIKASKFVSASRSSSIICTSVKRFTLPGGSRVFNPPREQRSLFALFDDLEEIMYQSAALVRGSSGNFTIVLTFSLLGLALSLLMIGKAGFIDPGYMANLVLSF